MTVQTDLVLGIFVQHVQKAIHLKPGLGTHDGSILEEVYVIHYSNVALLQSCKLERNNDSTIRVADDIAARFGIAIVHVTLLFAITEHVANHGHVAGLAGR